MEECFLLSTFSSKSIVLRFQWRSRKLKVQVLIFFMCVNSLRAEGGVQCNLDLKQKSWLNNRSCLPRQLFEFKGVHVAWDKKAAASQRTRVLHVKRVGRVLMLDKHKELLGQKDPDESKSDSEERKVQSSGGKIISVCSWSWRKHKKPFGPQDSNGVSGKCESLKWNLIKIVNLLRSHRNML